MRVAQINATCGSGSTGKICVSISELLNRNGIENLILYSQGNSSFPQGVKYSGKIYKKGQALQSRLLGNWGFNSSHATNKLIKHLDAFSPDVVHIHNIHAHDCDMEKLFAYLKKKKIRVIWTFHDCWALTGYCMHFEVCGCSKWISGCTDCPQKKSYSWIFDRSGKLQQRKIQCVSGCDLSIAVPSRWMENIVKRSMLKQFSVSVIPNGIDTTIFYRRDTDIRHRLSVPENVIIILGVASQWNNNKGLDTFIELANVLDDRYRIILVGTDAGIDRLLPDRIIPVHRTADQNELAELYSAASVFFNPTREDTFPTVNMEALACGTPVLTFDVCGSPEVINDSNGLVLPDRNMKTVLDGINDLCAPKIDREKISSASAEFDYRKRLNAYLLLYKKIQRCSRK